MYFFSSILTILILISSPAYAGDLSRPDYIERSHQILTNTNQDNLKKNDYTHDANKLLQDAQKASNVEAYPITSDVKRDINRYLKNIDVNPPSNQCYDSTDLTKCELSQIKDYPKQETIIYISSSMPPELIRQSIQEAKQQGSVIVIRGLVPGTNIIGTSKHFASIATNKTIEQEFHIDPLKYKKYNVNVVPSVTVFNGSAYITVPGTVSVSYAKKRLEDGYTGLHPKVYDTYPIAEVDFIEDLQQRFAKIDFKELAKKGVSKFWTHFKPIELPHSDKNTTYQYDPTVIVAEDVSLPNGKLLATAGSSFNPLKAIPFTNSYLFFDASSSSQVEFVKDLIKQHRDKYKAITPIATNVMPDMTWEKFHNLRESIGGTLFLANENLVSRLKVKTTPTKITPLSENIEVTEYAVQ